MQMARLFVIAEVHYSTQELNTEQPLLNSFTGV